MLNQGVATPLPALTSAAPDQLALQIHPRPDRLGQQQKACCQGSL
jgi:hypothetical protein